MEEVRKTIEAEKGNLSEKIVQRLENACVYREKNIEKMKDKLREHVSVGLAVQATQIVYLKSIAFEG